MYLFKPLNKIDDFLKLPLNYSSNYSNKMSYASLRGEKHIFF
jgi:hypothetical protein